MTNKRYTYQKKLISAGSTLNIYAKADTQKVFQVFAQCFWLLQSRRTVRRDQIQSFKWLFIEVRWLRFNHFYSHNAQGPDIDFGTVLFLFDYFGRHPIRSTDHRRPFGLLICKFSTKTEIGYGKQVRLWVHW